MKAGFLDYFHSLNKKKITYKMVTFSKHISVIVLSTITMSVSKTSAPILNKQKMAYRCDPGEEKQHCEEEFM